MDCRDYHRQFIDFINDELGFNETSALVSHVMHCEECSSDLKNEYLMITGMRKLDRDPVPKNIPTYEEKIKMMSKKCRREKLFRILSVLFIVASTVISVYFFIKGLVL
ncbi:MAG: zf-HC2 domain-containing protein [Lachnospiraceae bacterium]|nr:zf-HC2 domain-containing protein [Lachnospiraceae bacterium]